MKDSNNPPNEVNNDSTNKPNPEQEGVRWDYTSRKGTLYTGAAVIGLNLLVVVLLILDRTVPAIHSFFTGKPL